MAASAAPFPSISEFLRRTRQAGLVESPYHPYEDGRYFFPTADQEWLITETLKLVAEKETHNSIMVGADSGGGMRTLARRITCLVDNEPYLYTHVLKIDQDEKGPPTPGKVVRQICASMGIGNEVTRHIDRMAELKKFLTVDIESTGRSVLLVINLDACSEIVYLIHELADWVTAESNPRTLFQFLLYGNSGDYYANTRGALSKLNHVWSRLLPTPSKEEKAELLEKMARAAGRKDNLFTPEALKLLIDNSKPPLGHVIGAAERSLETMLEENQTVITKEIVAKTMGLRID